MAGGQQQQQPSVPGGRFDFDDGGTYCGGWEDGKAHGHGVCTGPKSQGEYSGSWHYGFEVSGVYLWPSGSRYEGQWQNGKRHGLGVESRGRWSYRGEWSLGFKGRYGVRQSAASQAKYEGTWANGLQDGYGSETYADGGTFQGQWMRGMRHGYGARTSASFGLASRPPKSARGSLQSIPAVGESDPAVDRDRRIDDFRGGFVLKSRSDEPPQRRRSLVEKSTNLKKSILQGLKIKKQRSTGDIDRRGTSSIRSSGSNLSSASSESGGLSSKGGEGSLHTDSNASFVSQDELCDTQVTETYLGEWKNDRRCGFGIAERSDGLKYEGEWYNNKKYGYGVTTLRDGTREEGKYKNNVLVSSGKKKHLFLLRSSKFRERVEAAVQASLRASQIALQKADIAISRMATARGKAEQADMAAIHAEEDSNVARMIAKQFDPDAKMPDMMKSAVRVNPPTRVPFTNLSNQPTPNMSPDVSRPETPMRNSMPGRTLSLTQRYPKQAAQDRYMGGAPRPAAQYPPSQNALPINANVYANAQHAVHHDARYMPPQQIDNRYAPQPSYANSGYGGYQSQTIPPQQQYPHPPQQYSPTQQQYPSSSSYPSPQQQYPSPQQQYPSSQQQYPSSQQQYPPSQQYHTDVPPQQSPYIGQHDAPPVPHRQGSFRHRPSAQGGYSMQQAMGDHFDHYRQHEPRPRTVIKGGRRIPSPARGGRETTPLYGTQSPRSSYGPPDATPDSGVSESMDELSPSRFGRKPRLPPMLYDGSSLLSFAPSEEDGRTVSPTMSSVGLDSEAGSETSQASFPRTASLYVNPPSRRKPEVASSGGGGGGGGALNRKKSMPHGPKEMASTPQKVIPREEVAFLSSQRREEVRRMHYESERLRANPLLYLVRPDLKDWFSRQQMIMLVLFINISLAIIFYKLLS